MKFDLAGIAAFTLDRNRDFIDDPNMTPEVFIALMEKHEANQCGGSCGFCKIDQDAATFVIADNAAASIGKKAVPFPRRRLH